MWRFLLLVGLFLAGLVPCAGQVTNVPNNQLTLPVPPQGRLTLQSNTPVMTTSQTAKTTIFYDCYRGSAVGYFDGTFDRVETIASCEVSTVLQSASTGVINNGDVFDVWWVHSGANRICVATNGAGGGWASDTAGSTTARGTGYSALDRTTRGYLTNKNALTHCYNGATDYGSVPANQATYLGTFFSTAAGQTGVQFGSATAGGGAALIYLWNNYNRVKLTTIVVDSTANWTIASDTVIRALNPGATGSGLNNRVSWVSGLAEDGIDAALQVVVQPGASQFASSILGIQLDGTSAFDRRNLVEQANVAGAGVTLAVGLAAAATARNQYAPQVGQHFIQALQQGDSNAGTIFYGSTNEGLSFVWQY